MIKTDGIKPTIYDILGQVVYSKYMIYDVLHMRLYATCRCFSHRNGRVAGLYYLGHCETLKNKVENHFIIALDLRTYMCVLKMCH